MFKLIVIAAVAACANGYYNHGPIAHAPYPAHYGHGFPSVPLQPINPHYGSVVHNNHGYAGHIGAAPSAQTKIIHATYPGAVHKLANDYANPAGYPHAPISHDAASYVHAPAAAIVQHPTISYDHRSPTNYPHSHYAVTEGPTNYAAHSRYAIAASPALSYGHQARYPIAHGGHLYNHGLSVDHGVRKISYAPSIAHMGYQNHAAHAYSW